MDIDWPEDWHFAEILHQVISAHSGPGWAVRGTFLIVGMQVIEEKGIP